MVDPWKRKIYIRLMILKINEILWRKLYKIRSFPFQSLSCSFAIFFLVFNIKKISLYLSSLSIKNKTHVGYHPHLFRFTVICYSLGFLLGRFGFWACSVHLCRVFLKSLKNRSLQKSPKKEEIKWTIRKWTKCQWKKRKWNAEHVFLSIPKRILHSLVSAKNGE